MTLEKTVLTDSNCWRCGNPIDWEAVREYVDVVGEQRRTEPCRVCHTLLTLVNGVHVRERARE